MKTEEMNQAILHLTGIDVNKAIETEVCPSCGKKCGEFRDELSRQEQAISGLCQSCQDEVFGGQ